MWNPISKFTLLHILGHPNQDNRLSVSSHITDDVNEALGREDEASGETWHYFSSHTTDDVKEAPGKEDEASGETWHSISSHTTDDVWTIFWPETFLEYIVQFLNIDL